MQLGLLLVKCVIAHLEPLPRVGQAVLEIAAIVATLLSTFLLSDNLLLVVLAQGSALAVFATVTPTPTPAAVAAAHRALAQPRKEFISEFRALMMVCTAGKLHREGAGGAAVGSHPLSPFPFPGNGCVRHPRRRLPRLPARVCQDRNIRHGDGMARGGTWPPKVVMALR
jgi:hypothetical protein